MTNQQVLNQPVPTQPSPADPPTAHSSPDQLAAAVERDHISPTSHSETPAAPAEHAASQPAKVQRSPSLTLTTPPPAEAQDVHPCMTVHMEPAIEAKHVAPAVSAAIPQAAPVSMTTEDSVASAGCFRMFCCSKAPRSKQKKGSVWLECRQRLRKGVR